MVEPVVEQRAAAARGLARGPGPAGALSGLMLLVLTGTIVAADEAKAPPPAAKPAAPPALDGLRGAMVSGYRDNPSIEARRAGQKAVDEGVAKALAALRPTVTVSASRGFVEDDRKTPDFEDMRQVETGSIGASMTLFDGLSSINAVRAAEARARAGRAGLSDAEQRLLAEIAKAHADVWRDREIAKLEDRNIRFLAEQVRSVRRRITLGDLSRTDLAQTEARYNEARAALELARAELAASQSTYAELVGEAAGRIGLPPVPDRLLPNSLDAALEAAAAHNPLIRKAEEDVKAADSDVDVRAGAFFPKVTLDTRYDSNLHTSSSYESSEETSVYVRLNFPLYDGGGREAAYREAKARAVEKSYERAATRRGVWSSVTTLWHRRIASANRIAAARAQLAAAETAVKGVSVEADVGERSVIDVLDAQREANSARITLARARAEHVATSFQLAAALGRCTPEALGLPVDPYDAGARLASIKRSWLGLFVR